MYAVVDVETTGGEYNQEGITEIAIYKFDGVKIVDRLVSLVNPQRPIQPFVEKLTGITDKMVRRAPKFYQIAKHIIEITKDCIIVAHNATFDYRMLCLEYKRLGYEYKRPILCTVKLSRELIHNQKSYSLGKLATSLGIPFFNRHRAEGDVIVTVKLFQILLEKDSEKIIIKTHLNSHKIAQKTILKKYISIIDSLPEEVGLYYIYNRVGDIIFMSISKNIKSAVTQHLVSNDKISQTIQEQIMEVSCEQTGSYLVANLKYNEEIDKMSPLLNERIEDSELGIFKFSYPAQNIAIVDYGRTSNERSVVLIKDGLFIGCGYYTLNRQLKTSILETLVTPMKSTKKAIKLIEHYLSKEQILKIVSLEDRDVK